MKSTHLIASILAALTRAAPTVDEKYPYNGPKVPIGDWLDPTINGNGKGFHRLVEAPAVQPASENADNNVNVISLSYIPAKSGGDSVGINIHYQTPFGLGVAPSVYWGTSPSSLNNVATGLTATYDRTPPCSLVAVTQCSQFFHNVQIEQLQPGTTYFYQIPAANGTTQSTVLSFTTAQATGNPSQFSIAINNDMGYTNAGGTYKYMNQAMNDEDGLAFVWHGGDLSYADDWYSGIIQCNASVWPVCYNGSFSSLPNNDTNPDYFDTPLPANEIPNQGSPRGGDVGVLYESNWDLWQQWMNTITMKIPYIVLPGNHEATCADHDNTPYVLSSYLNENKTNTTMSGDNPNATLTYYSCPPSQRNFTAFQNRFSMAGDKSGGVGNFWHSFDYGLVHFVSIDTETDYAHSPDKTFREDIEKAKEEEDCKGKDKDKAKCKPEKDEPDTYECKTINLGDDYETDDLEEEAYLLSGKAHPLRNETHITDAGPFGYIDGSIKDNKAYEQYQWLKNDLASVDRCKTPWVIVMGHRPMYSSHGGNYHLHLREAFEKLLLKHKVDLYIAGHVHWYERLKPIRNCAVDTASVKSPNTYEVNPGYSMVHLINGAAGNIESHSTINMSQPIPDITAHRNLTSFGFSKLTVYNATTLSWQFIQGHDGLVGDELTVLKDPSLTCEGYNSYSSSGSSGSSCSSECSGSGLLAWLYCNLYCSSFWEPLKL
ncbi:acid phosphatase [Fusarium oxysporum NRRL 32931]|uniref:Purple acid phosphatase n=1 Tax=Fusarium oxysporum NRRL 32931 TaxID=660029 RepID=W9HK93_FUSOX|nr:acid phosphatase [Fusarium oxysporum NRRL 32931]